MVSIVLEALWVVPQIGKVTSTDSEKQRQSSVQKGEMLKTSKILHRTLLFP